MLDTWRMNHQEQNMGATATSPPRISEDRGIDISWSQTFRSYGSTESSPQSKPKRMAVSAPILLLNIKLGESEPQPFRNGLE